MTFSTGITSQSFSLPIIDDNIAECTETFDIQLSAISICGISLGSAHNLQVTIKDDDSK